MNNTPSTKAMPWFQLHSSRNPKNRPAPAAAANRYWAAIQPPCR
ncbi:Uncharacterised protein [Mycobacteroides abscessus subsp. abscessus]|nr:Uncharacterised protein [Mycobacteroides abscessus subsp. abscessus]